MSPTWATAYDEKRETTMVNAGFRSRIGAAKRRPPCRPGNLRSHRFPNFPDPTSSGQVTQEMLANAGINLQQPAVQAADACVSVTHGVITKTVVARFVAGD